jgi:hypothetical protein
VTWPFRSRSKWGVFEGDPVEVAPNVEVESLHVAPCDRRGKILPPHIREQNCFCRPRFMVCREGSRAIIIHETVQ